MMTDLDQAYTRYVTACLIAGGIDISLLCELTRADRMELLVDAFHAMPPPVVAYHDWCAARGLDCADAARAEFEQAMNDRCFSGLPLEDNRG